MLSTVAKETKRRAEKAEHEANSHDLESDVQAIGKDVREFIESAVNSANEGIATAKEKIGDTTSALTARVHKKPIASIAIAAGAGLLLGILLRRR